MAADALIPYIARSPAASMALTMYIDLIPVFHKEGFQLSIIVPKSRGDRKCKYICIFPKGI